MKTPEFPTEHMKTLAEAFLRDGLDGHRMVVSVAMDAHAALRAALAERTAVCEESNAVCACGCPDGDHESYGEDGESCGVDGHDCVRTSRSVAGMLAGLHVALEEAQATSLDLETRLSGLLDRLTCGLFSKPGYSVDQMESFIDEAYQKRFEEEEAEAHVRCMTLQAALAEAQRERDEADRSAAAWLRVSREVEARAESAERELAEAIGLLLDVWDSHHREGWEQTETFDSVMDRVSDWRWNAGYDPCNPPLRPDPRVAREAKPEGEKL